MMAHPGKSRAIGDSSCRCADGRGFSIPASKELPERCLDERLRCESSCSSCGAPTRGAVQRHRISEPPAKLRSSAGCGLHFRLQLGHFALKASR